MYEIKKDYMDKKVEDSIIGWVSRLKDYLISNYDKYKENFKKYNTSV